MTSIAVEIAPITVATLHQAARRAHPQETGGLLTGWWDNDRIVVHRAIEVRDPTATTNEWTRSQESAQAALDTLLDNEPHPLLGYVGDWHSHPADAGPSRQDLNSIRTVSRQFEHPVLLIVRRSTGRIDHVVVNRGRRRTTRFLTLDGNNDDN